MLAVFSLSALDMYVDTDLEITYTNNVLKLSDHDLNRFESGEEIDKFELETTDDLIFSALIKVGFKNYLIGGHTQRNELYFKYNYHLENSFLDDGYLGYKFTQYLNRKINFELSYFYYPEIYVNRYTSELESNGVYRDFTYSKNVYNAEINWKTHSLMELTYRFAFSQLFYNKYFTEYDAVNFENRLTMEFFPKAKIRTKISYKYKISNADGKDAFADPDLVDVIKDASYEANTYSISCSVPRLFSIGKRRFYFTTEISYEQRYFTNDDQEDEYHFARDDYTFTADASISINLINKLNLKLSGKFQQRNTDSPFSTVERDKNYDLYEVGLKLGRDF